MALVYHTRQHANSSSGLGLDIPSAVVDGLVFLSCEPSGPSSRRIVWTVNDVHISHGGTRVFSTLLGIPEASRCHQALVEYIPLPGRHWRYIFFGLTCIL